MRLTWRILSLAILAGALAACPGTGPSGQPDAGSGDTQVSTIELTPTTASVQAGNHLTFTAVARDASGQALSGVTFTWSSSAPSVASVEGGTVTGLQVGTTQVTASAGGKTSNAATLTVTDPNDPNANKVASIALSPTSATLSVGQQQAFTAVAKNAQGQVLSNVAFTWSSSAPTVAEVSSGGIVTAHTAGSASLTATAQGVTSNAAAITVPEPALFTLSLASQRVTLMPGESATLAVQLTRTQGFTGPATLTVKGLPAGVTVAPVTVGAGESSATLTVQASPTAPESASALASVVGSDGTGRSTATTLYVTVRGGAGAPDLSFGTNGKMVLNASERDDYAHAMAVQTDGKLVVVGGGFFFGDNGGDFLVARFTVDGALDPSFGVGGIVHTDFGSLFDEAHAVALQEDGKVVVVGRATTTHADDFAVVRYNANGTLDTTFDGDGKVITSFGEGNDRAYAVVVQPDGKLLVAGESYMGDVRGVEFSLVRYTATGALDTTFDGDGKLVLQAPDSVSDCGARALALQEVSGEVRAVVAGGASDFVLWRLKPDGTLDTTFGEGGLATGFYPAAGNAEARQILLTGGGLLVVGQMDQDFAMVRLHADGTKDTGFGTDGTVQTSFGETDSEDEAYAATVDPEGRIVVAGYTSDRTEASKDLAVARYDAQGLLDDSFSEDGKLVFPLLAGAPDEARAMVLQPDPRLEGLRIVVAGYAYGDDADFALARFWQ